MFKNIEDSVNIGFIERPLLFKLLIKQARSTAFVYVNTSRLRFYLS